MRKRAWGLMRELVCILRSFAFSHYIGLLMMIDTMDERGFCQADKRWMEPAKCYFPLFDFIKPLPGRWMCLTYAFMFAGKSNLTSRYESDNFRTRCSKLSLLGISRKEQSVFVYEISNFKS